MPVEGRVFRMLRPHEHQVLEQMREAGSPRLFIAGPDVIPHVHRDDRHGMILVHDHRQPVGQGVHRNRDLERRGLGRQRGNTGGDESQCPTRNVETT